MIPHHHRLDVGMFQSSTHGGEAYAGLESVDIRLEPLDTAMKLSESGHSIQLIGRRIKRTGSRKSCSRDMGEWNELHCFLVLGSQDGCGLNWKRSKGDGNAQ